MNSTTLSVLLAIGLSLLVLWILFGLLLVAMWRIAKRRAKRIEAYVNQPAFSTHDFNLVKTRENLTKDEVDQIRELIRHRKEQGALDTATEFNNEV